MRRSLYEAMSDYDDSGTGFDDCYLLHKSCLVRDYITTMLCKTLEMFRWSGLPDTIPSEQLERLLQMGGHCAIVKHEGDLYALAGGFGGAPDPYYRPTLYVVANPALNISGAYTIRNFLAPGHAQSAKGRCVVIGNTGAYSSLSGLYRRYAEQLAENTLSIRSSQINSRAMLVFTAHTDREKESAELFLSRLEEGRTAVMTESIVEDGINALPVNVRAGLLTELVELHQYLLASWYRELGIPMNPYLKREYVSENELSLSEPSIGLLVRDMLITRQRCVEQVNDEYGTDISVDLSPAWKVALEGTGEKDELVSASANDDSEATENRGDGESEVEVGDTELTEAIQHVVEDTIQNIDQDEIQADVENEMTEVRDDEKG